MQAEEIMEKKIASAMEVCKKYNRIKIDGKKAEAVWKYNLDMAADAKYPKETEMYEEYADKALTGFKASIKWLKIVDRAMRMVLPYEAEQVLIQHFVEGKPLKSIRGGRNQYMSRTTATKYKKIGIQKLADNIFSVEADLKKLEETLENSL